jgi:serine/threonine protein kinase
VKPGYRYGSWTLVERLDRGGNGVVWLARHDDGRSGAVKVLHRLSGERRARFRDEIEFLLGDPGEGILPLIDCDDGSEPGWYVMPVATPLRDALGEDATLEQRVAAIQMVASTPSRLAAQGIGHRDVKPENLFGLNGEFMVGDFGLVTYPEKDPVTRSGKRLGPIDYMAPEMRADADTAAAEPADVYSSVRRLGSFSQGMLLLCQARIA